MRSLVAAPLARPEAAPVAIIPLSLSFVFGLRLNTGGGQAPGCPFPRRESPSVYMVNSKRASILCPLNDGPVARADFKAAKMAFWDGAYDAGFTPRRQTP